jgi:hypothetical protein
MVKEVFAVKEPELIDRLPDAIRACLANLPNVVINDLQRNVSLSDDTIADLVVELSILDRKKTLIVEAKGNGQPKQARQAIGQLERLVMGERIKDPYPVFAAPYVSNASAAICRESGVGYADLAGNCRLAFDNIYVEKESADNPFRENRGRASLFAPKASRILRVLLSDSERDWQVQQLSSAAGVSIGLASRIKGQLEEREWVVAGENGIRVAQPEAILEAWVATYDYRQSPAQEYYTPDSTGDIEFAIANWCRENDVQYALTGFSAARLSAPRVRYNRASIFVRSKQDAVAVNTNLKPVDSGGNVILLEPYDDGVFEGARDLYGMRAVSPVQLYLDLRSMPGRGEEAAEEILVRELRPSW